MQKHSARQRGQVWLAVLLLIVFVGATTFALISRLGVYMVSDTGAIDLMQAPAATGSTLPTSTTTAPTTSAPTRPGFEASDDQTVWATDTRVEIFRVSYVNGEQQVTVHSNDGDRLIAPGTENSYVFKLKNTGNAALQYALEVNATVTGADTLPVTARLSRYDGHWVTGDKDTYTDLAELDAAADQADLGAGRFAYYTLDWQWPFEGDDSLDTLLGNLSTERDITLTIEIKTVATLHENPDDDSGLRAPQTGEESRTALWIALAAGSFCMLLFFLFFREKEDKDQPAAKEARH